MNKTVIVKTEFSIEIPDEKIKEILPDFRKTITSGADENDLFKQVAYGAGILNDDFVEGIGSIRDEGIECNLGDVENEIFEE